MAILLSLPGAYATYATVSAGFLAAYCVVGMIYRLYFHPLAKFPGPRLAAATQWYEFYYDCIQFGQYTFQIARLHEKYGQWHNLQHKGTKASKLILIKGPLIRISPNELHCNDPDFIGTL